jgi:signal transduction histidine kinase
MRVPEVFRSSVFRATLAFALATTVAILVIFGFVYWRITSADEDHAGAVVVHEASGADYTEVELERALELRLTRDLRRLDYVALFDSAGKLKLGNVPRLPDIPVDGQSHLVARELLPGAADRYEPAVFVARRRADGGVFLLGRSLADAYALRKTVVGALATAIPATFLLALAIGMLLARRMTRRLGGLHDTIARIMQGGLQLRLPLSRSPDEIDQLSRDVNVMLDEIVRLMAQVRGVGENIAHDLRTPLSVVRIKLERGLAARDEPALRLAAAEALEQLDKAIAAIAALLRVGEIENRPGSHRFTRIDLSGICADLFEFYEPLGRAKSISMALEAAAPVLIEGDGDLMREALSNLIDNAIKFTPEGGVVRVMAGMESGQPVIRVCDNGAGVPSEARERIFDRYFRADRANSSRGSGVGLSIATAIAHLHGLDLRVIDNNPGARFELFRASPSPTAPPFSGKMAL